MKTTGIEIQGVAIRPAQPSDLGQIIALDAEVTGIEKTDYWYEVFTRYGQGHTRQRHFLVAESDGMLRGFVIGDVRDWEFGSPPCGWVFTMAVRPDGRLKGLGTQLLQALCDAFRHAGVNKVRTLIARDNALMLSFFRSQGLMAAPVSTLEKELG